MVYYFTRESNIYMSSSGLPRLFPAPWQRPCSDLEPTSHVRMYEATRQGFPGTQRPMLAMDSTAFPALPTVVRQHAKQVPRLILRSMRNHLGTATEVVKIHFKKNKYSAQRIYKFQLFCPSSQLRDDGKLSRQLRNMTPLFVSVLIRI